ncbi:hypothetical protein F5887DRAFT_1079035 [Amanita rubescens]|nr:hypothetical protein F5887DRAFT_1079035 [Amanita rubescens]
MPMVASGAWQSWKRTAAMVAAKLKSTTGLTNRGHAQSNLEASTIYDAMMQKRETLKNIEREVERLLEKKKGIEEELNRPGIVMALVPHDHDRLPDEVLSRIFALVARAHGPVDFPISKKNFPPQLAISHVCSRWRMVAFSTSALWCNTRLLYTALIDDRAVELHQRWLLRAGKVPVTLSVEFGDSVADDEVPRALQKILSPFQVKTLHVGLTFYEQFEELSKLPQTILTDTETELELDFILPEDGVDLNFSSQQHLINQLRSVTLYGHQLDIWLDKLSGSFPWRRLRSLDASCAGLENVHLILDILRQTQVLQNLQLTLYELHAVTSIELTMPSLLDFTLNIDNRRKHNNCAELDNVLRCFSCPSLTSFTLCSPTYWTGETFEILKQRYNMQKIQKINFINGFTLPLSSILRNAPMLCSLSILWSAILDDDAITGLSNGSLGQYLRRLEINVVCDIGEVLEMVEARKKIADRLIENGCNWREEIATLRDVVAHFRVSSKSRLGNEYRTRLNLLKEAGIMFHIKSFS